MIPPEHTPARARHCQGLLTLAGSRQNAMDGEQPAKARVSALCKAPPQDYATAAIPPLISRSRQLPRQRHRRLGSLSWQACPASSHITHRCARRSSLPYPTLLASPSSPFFPPPLSSVPFPSTSASSPMSSTNENEKADSATASRVMADEERGYALQLHDKMETEYLHPGSSHAGSTEEGLAHPSGAAPHSRYGYSAAYGYAADRAQVFWDRLCGKGRRRIGWIESLRNIATASRECFVGISMQQALNRRGMNQC